MKLTLNRDDVAALILAHVDKMLPGHLRRIDDTYNLPYEITVAIDEPEPATKIPPATAQAGDDNIPL